MANSVTLKALGLNKNSNQLEVPAGSMVQAKDVIIRRNSVVESRRGFKLYGSLLPNALYRVKQIFNYKNRLIRHYENALQFDDGTDFFVDINGNFTEPEVGLRIKTLETNENLYITTNNGVQKLSVTSADDLETTTPIKSGGVKSVDFNVRLQTEVGSGSGILPQDSVVAYRTLWVIKDINGNLIQGTPSPNTQIYASLQDFIIKDIVKLCQNLDKFSSSLVNDGDYTSTIASQINSLTTGVELKDILGGGPINLCKKLDEDIDFSEVNLIPASVTISNGTATLTLTGGSGDPSIYINSGDILYLKSFEDASGNDLKYNGFQTITAVDGPSKTIKFSTSETVATAAVGTIEWGEFRYLYETADSTSQYGVPLSDLTVTSPTSNDQLGTIQNLLQRIMNKLTTCDNDIVSTSDKSKISPSLVTESSRVFLDISIPDEVVDSYIDNTYYFLQVYRTKLSNGLVTGNIALEDFVNAGGAGDECFLIYEAYPTSDEITSRKMTIEDVTADSLSTTPLYTNSQSGEGILQENDRPPFCKDITLFKTHTFFSNTKTHHKLQLGLLSVSGLNEDYDAGRFPYFVISRENNTSTAYEFVKGTLGTRTIQITATGASLDGRYFIIYPYNSFNDGTSTQNYSNSLNPKKYVVWYKNTTSITLPVADYPSQEVVGIEIDISGLATTSDIAQKTKDYLSLYPEDFEISVSTNSVIIDNIEYGVNGSSSVTGTGLTLSSDTLGTGEKVTAGKILLYPNGPEDSTAFGIEATAKSIVRVLNYSTSETVSSFYISNLNTVPGTFLLENRSLSDPQFYVSVDTNNLTNLSGSDFQPDISPDATIVSTNLGSNIVTISTNLTASDFSIGTQVVVFNSEQTGMNGLRTVTNNASFPSLTLDVAVTSTVGAATGCIIRASETEASSNEEKSHRLYYSKASQPEAVPVLNYLDIGLSGHDIKRIIPLRDSLFIFKEDGLYRLSGSAPFQVSIFDTSVILLAPDSIGLTENLIFGWCQQGITTISEGGINVISRPIDSDVLELSSAQYPNFNTLTWGVGYTSDNSYIVFTNSSPDDDYASFAYRYSNLTQTWTTYDLSANCGIVNGSDDILYLGAGDTNSLLKERKTLDRTDYTDRELTRNIDTYDQTLKSIRISDTTNISIGDVLIQNQTLTINRFNMLLQKLDLDHGTHSHDYYSTLVATSGQNIRAKLVQLATKLDADTLSFNNYFSEIASQNGSFAATAISTGNQTTITDPSHGLLSGRIIELSGANSNRTINGVHEIIQVATPNTFKLDIKIIDRGTNAVTYETVDDDFRDVVVCFNNIINKLNLDTAIAFSNYLTIDHDTIQESVITSVDVNTKLITIVDPLELTLGEVTIYNAIDCELIYSPYTAEDPSMTKQFSEASLLFENRNFTSVVMSFSSDLFPGFSSVTFNGDGNGAFGSSKFGLQFFGGVRNSAPLRTYVPTYAQRCTHINVKFNHRTAREKYSLFGLNLKFRPISTRAYWR